MAIWIFPIVLYATAASLCNAWLKRPEYTYHPKAIAAFAALIFAVIGFQAGNMLPALSHVLGFFILLNIECRITPGGFRRVLKDVLSEGEYC